MSIKQVVFNKKANFLYHLTEKFQAGLVLQGSEVKSLRAGRCHLKDAYISFKGEEAFLQKAHISPYAKALQGGHEPERLRKLLLTKKELQRIQGLMKQKTMTCVPLRIYFEKGKAKMEISLAQGKSFKDKREDLKKKETDRQMKRVLKRTRSLKQNF